MPVPTFGVALPGGVADVGTLRECARRIAANMELADATAPYAPFVPQEPDPKKPPAQYRSRLRLFVDLVRSALETPVPRLPLPEPTYGPNSTLPDVVNYCETLRAALRGHRRLKRFLAVMPACDSADLGERLRLFHGMVEHSQRSEYVPLRTLEEQRDFLTKNGQSFALLREHSKFRVEGLRSRGRETRIVARVGTAPGAKDDVQVTPLHGKRDRADWLRRGEPRRKLGKFGQKMRGRSRELVGGAEVGLTVSEYVPTTVDALLAAKPSAADLFHLTDQLRALLRHARRKKVSCGLTSLRQLGQVRREDGPTIVLANFERVAKYNPGTPRHLDVLCVLLCLATVPRPQRRYADVVYSGLLQSDELLEDMPAACRRAARRKDVATLAAHFAAADGDFCDLAHVACVGECAPLSPRAAPDRKQNAGGE